MRDYVRGVILGGAIGDALGMPFEGLSKKEMKQQYGVVGTYVNSVYSPHTKGLVRGSYTDDTQLTLATVESIIAQKKVDIQDLGRCFAELYRQKDLIAAGRATKRALKNIVKGQSAYESGILDAYGCGAATRIAPIGLLPEDGRDKETLVCEVTSITHASTVAVASAMAIAYAVAYLFGGKNSVDSVSEKRKFLEHIWFWTNYAIPAEEPDFSRKIELLEVQINKSFEEVAEQIGTTGLATHVVPLAIFSFLKEPRNFGKLMTQTINCGGDTDSRASLAGSLYGAYNGFSKIPVRYYVNLKDNKRILQVADQFSALLSE